MKHTYKQKSLRETHGEENIIALFYETRGKVSHVAAKLGCASSALYNLINEDPNMAAELQKAREMARDDRIDDCETYAETIAERYEDDASNGLKAAIYFMNTHGKHRGYGKDVVDVGEELKQMRELLAQKVGPPPKPIVE